MNDDFFWLLIMVDYTWTRSPWIKKDRNAITRYKTALDHEGFCKLEPSVFARDCRTIEKAKEYKKKMAELLPPNIKARMLVITDKQFSKMEVFFGKHEVFQFDQSVKCS